MNLTKTIMLIGLTAGGSLLGAAARGAEMSNEQLMAELKSLKTEVAQLRTQQGENWMTERRAAEIKSLVRDVLADADTRASLMDSAITAGHNGKNFFLTSEDGKFLLNIAGQIQFRYIWNNVDEDSSTDDNMSGFQLRRTKLKFTGHISDPKIKYVVVLANERDTGTTYLEESKVSYKFDNGIEIAGGRFKGPFLREELTSSSQQLTVERSVINEFFTTGFTEGVQLGYATDTWSVAAMFNDGQNQGEVGTAADWNDVDSDFAVTARGEVALLGKLKQAGDFNSWSGEETLLLIGGGVHYQVGESDTAGTFPTAEDDDKFIWTVDAALEWQGLGAFVAATGQLGTDDSTQVDIPEDVGLVAQVGYMVIPDKLEPFVRWEHFFNDADAESDFDILTFGMNYYLAKHTSKFTLDLVWILDDVPSRVGLSDGLGLRNVSGIDGDKNQVALRAQYQLLF
ncbi:MAG: porin [Phycisphaerales bacterium]